MRNSLKDRQNDRVLGASDKEFLLRPVSMAIFFSCIKLFGCRDRVDQWNLTKVVVLPREYDWPNGKGGKVIMIICGI